MSLNPTEMASAQRVGSAGAHVHVGTAGACVGSAGALGCASECCICLEPFSHECCLTCGHKYNVQCILKVLTVSIQNGQRAASCPMCRAQFNVTHFETPLKDLRDFLDSDAAPRDHKQSWLSKRIQHVWDRLGELKVQSAFGRNLLFGTLGVKAYVTINNGATAPETQWANTWTLSIVVVIATVLLVRHIVALPINGAPHVSAAHRKLAITLNEYDRARAGLASGIINLDLGTVWVFVAMLSLFLKWLC